jgi:hypothetical protein
VTNLIQHIANKNIEAVVPLVNGAARYQQRKIKLSSRLNGWYVLNIGNNIDVLREASLREIRDVPMKTLLGLSFGENIVPFSFENFSKLGFSSTEPVTYFGRIIRDWGLVRVAITEDRRLIFVKEEEVVRVKKMLRRMKTIFDSEETLGIISGLTPEMRYLFIHHSFMREQQREMEKLVQLKLEQQKLEEAVREMNRTVEGRIRLALAQSGASLVSIKRLSQRENSDVRVVWEIIGDNGRTERVSSLVKHDTLAVIPSGLGFCASNGDTTQTLSSAPALAKAYMRSTGSVYITRTDGLGSFARFGHAQDGDIGDDENDNW